MFGNGIATLVQHENRVEVTFEDGTQRNFDFVFGADGTHSAVRMLIFGSEEEFKKFFEVYFAFAEADHIQTGRPKNTGIVYRELGKQAVIYQFKDAANAILLFRAPKLEWDYRDHPRQKQILKEYFAGNQNWKIPEILTTMLHSDNLYFDEACQIHMPGWTKRRGALIGDAAHTPSFFTGMGTSLALQGATLLAKALHTNEDYQTTFKNYEETFKPFAENIQSRINRGLKVQLPETEQERQAFIERWSNKK